MKYHHPLIDFARKDFDDRRFNLRYTDPQQQFTEQTKRESLLSIPLRPNHIRSAMILPANPSLNDPKQQQFQQNQHLSPERSLSPTPSESRLAKLESRASRLSRRIFARPTSHIHNHDTQSQYSRHSSVNSIPKPNFSQPTQYDEDTRRKLYLEHNPKFFNSIEHSINKEVMYSQMQAKASKDTLLPPSSQFNTNFLVRPPSRAFVPTPLQSQQHSSSSLSTISRLGRANRILKPSLQLPEPPLPHKHQLNIDNINISHNSVANSFDTLSRASEAARSVQFQQFDDELSKFQQQLEFKRKQQHVWLASNNSQLPINKANLPQQQVAVRSQFNMIATPMNKAEPKSLLAKPEDPQQVTLAQVTPLTSSNNNNNNNNKKNNYHFNFKPIYESQEMKFDRLITDSQNGDFSEVPSSVSSSQKATGLRSSALF